MWIFSTNFFKSKVSITIDTKKPISSTQLKKLKILENAEIQDFSRDKRSIKKRIYKVGYKKLGKTSFILDLVADGGISIKSLIQQSDVVPNVSELLENQCECKKFDFKNIVVWILKLFYTNFSKLCMNPLQKLSQSLENGVIPKSTYELIQKRFHLVSDGIMRIEKASSIKYPTMYVEPSILISGSTNSLDVGILYARTIPLIVHDSIYNEVY